VTDTFYGPPTFVAERSGSTHRARLAALRLERTGLDHYDHNPDAFRFRGGGPAPEVGVATPVVVRRVG